MTLQDQVIKRFCNFIQRSSSIYRTTQTSLVAIQIVVVDIVNLSRDLA